MEKYVDGIFRDSTEVQIEAELETVGLDNTTLTAFYRRQGAAEEDLTMSVLAWGAAHTPGGIRTVGATNFPGSYVVDFPDAAFQSGVEWVYISIHDVTADVWYKKKINLLEDRIATLTSKFECLAACAFDQESERFVVTAWLEKDGEIQDDATSCTIRLYDVDGTLIFESTNAVPFSAGQFRFEQIPVQFTPDESYFLKIEITDVLAVIHKGGCSPTVWD